MEDDKENRDTKDDNPEEVDGAGEDTDDENEGDDSVDEDDGTFLFPSISDTCNVLETGDNTVTA